MKTLSLCAAVVLLLIPFPADTSASRVHVFHHENVLGTSFELKVLAANEQQARAAEAAALSEIDRQARILSGYDPASEFSRWFETRHRPVRVSPEMIEVLALFDRWRSDTNGALDAASEAVSQVWKRAAASQRLPSRTELDSAVASVRTAHWRLDPDQRTATHLTGTPLRLNSFTKGYIADHASQNAMAKPGVHGVVVNIGGDLVIRGAMRESVAIADPSGADNAEPIARLEARDLAIATSGNYRRGFDIGGKHYSHIVDPRTGMPADRIVSATVAAPKASDAGALATALSILEPSEGRRLAERSGAEFLLVAANGARIASKGWRGFATAMPAVAAQAAPNGWDPTMKLLISFELARISDPRYRRPYVAVWIEDKDKFPVRTLALWVEKPRWLPDLRQWYRGDRMRSLAEGSEITASVSSATRAPGKYSLEWDGKDAAGKFVKAGKYIVCIEAAREHGTYQVIRQEMDFPGPPKQITLSANAELAAASLDYRKSAR